MSVSLKDFFAAHVAAALVNRADSPVTIARRAFDVADALCAERQLREDLARLEDATNERMARPSDARAREKLFEPHLLDEPAPLDEEPELEDAEDPEVEELVALAARENAAHDEILALIDSAGYVPAWDPSWDDRADMTDWDRDAHWEHAVGMSPPSRRQSDRPGLARTVPEQMELRLDDSVVGRGGPEPRESENPRRRTGSS